MMSQGVEKLADEVLSRWEDHSWNRDRSPKSPPPSRAGLVELLDTAFLASLTYDERRPTRFGLILCPRDERQLLSNGNAPLRFANPLPFDPAHVRSLAPAADPSRVLIGVEVVSEDEHRKLHIWGLLDTGSSWSGFLRHERNSGRNPPDLVTVTSTEPGHLLVTRGGATIAILRGGSIIFPRQNVLSGDGPIGKFFHNAQALCYQEACKCLKVERYSAIDATWPQRSYLVMVERLLLNIASRNHGGALLLMPDVWRTEIRTWSPVVSVKYDIEDHRIWDLLIRSLELHRKYYDLKLSPKVLDREEYRELESYEHQREGVDDQMRDSVAFTGSLSGVDGAVIMTDKFHVIGFGAEVTAPAPVLHTIRSAKDITGTEFEIMSADAFGTRHRAAFRYCWSLPQAIAFVISQDGGVRAVRRVGDDVIMWSEVLAQLLAV